MRDPPHNFSKGIAHVRHTMHHVSEWMKFFDENAGRYRLKRKGTGVVRDTLMAIGKTLFTAANPVAKKAATMAAEKTGQKLGEVVAEKGAQKIQQILKNGGSTLPPSFKGRRGRV